MKKQNLFVAAATAPVRERTKKQKLYEICMTIALKRN